MGGRHRYLVISWTVVEKEKTKPPKFISRRLRDEDKRSAELKDSVFGVRALRRNVQ